jgi:nucleotide-binding universal stress UspA family protein
MSCKTILVHVDESKSLDRRIMAATRIALREQAHLIGIAVTGLSPLQPRPIVPAPDGSSVQPRSDEYVDMLRQRARSALERFLTLAHAGGVTSCDACLLEDEAVDALTRQSRYADLIVLGQSDADDPALTAKVDFPECVILNAACPVLIVPDAGQAGRIGERVLVAWNRSNAASRALRNAMPLLSKAREVRVALINPPARDDPRDEDAGAAIVAFLARHGIEAQAVQHSTEGDAGHALLALATEMDADLLVMGCVAHPRARGVLLGGATRVVLEAAVIPVLMSS